MQTGRLEPGRIRNPHAESAPCGLTPSRHGSGGLRPLDLLDATTVGERIRIVHTGIEAGMSSGKGSASAEGAIRGVGTMREAIPGSVVPRSSKSAAVLAYPSIMGRFKDAIARLDRKEHEAEPKKDTEDKRRGAKGEQV
ncbi:hypothetical protein FRC08_003628 [Ceratobasidium sp. 394]|nr:hypothetical protein FRC08_003628 [Ceratobasidium sp. 394]